MTEIVSPKDKALADAILARRVSRDTAQQGVTHKALWLPDEAVTEDDEEEEDADEN